MRFTDLFIRRPVLAVVVSLMMLMLGLRAYQQLELREYPEISYPVITVTTAYPGADAGLIKGFITTPLQHAMASVGGIDYLTSTSDQGMSTIKAYLDSSTDIDAALVQITAKVQKARGDLPRDAENPLVERETGMESETLQYISYSSDVLTPEQITDYLAKVVQPKISTLHGIARADLRGAKTYAMRIWLDPQRMAAFHISAEDVQQAIEQNNFQTAAGQTRGRYVLFNVTADTSLASPEEFRQIVVRSQGGTLVRIGDLGRVELGSEEYHTALHYGDRNVVFIRTIAAADANPLDAAKAVRDALPGIAAQLPDGVTQGLMLDTTFGIQHSINEVVKTIFEAALIVIVVIFLFLGSLRSVLIPVVAIPLSLVGVLGIMLLFGFSVNLLTLLAMVLAIGLVVDDAIVVVENIQRHIEEGAKPVKAALEGAREITFPVIAMTITLAAVYVPIGFLGGLTGVLFTEFAFTLAGAVVVSGIVALTLSPMMCSFMLKSEDVDHGLVRWLDERFEWLKTRYRRGLGAALANRSLVLLVAVSVLISIPFMYLSIQQELAPMEDDGVVNVVGRGPLYSSLDYTSRYAAQVQKIIKGVPELDKSFMYQGAFGSNSLFSLMILKPWGQRERSNKQVQDQLFAQLSKVAGMQLYAFHFPTIPGASADLPIQLVVTTTSSEQLLYQVATDVIKKMRNSGLFTFVKPELKFNKPVARVQINRDMASELGVSMRDIGHTLSVFLGENDTGRFSVDNYSYKVILQAGRANRLRPENLGDYYVKTRDGASVPLSTFVNLKIESQPNKLRQYQQQNAAFIGAQMTPGVTMGEAMGWLDTFTAKSLPEGFSHDYIGESRQFREEGGKLIWTFAFSFILIYLVLAAQFESFRDPLIILVSVPMSIFGALVPLVLGAATLNIYTQIGLVTLIGLISKHGILIVDFANRLQHDNGLSVREAVIKAASIRLRPILMTTAAMVFGVLPLLVATGAGANSRYCIGVVITTGIAVGTCFTLFVVPAIYTLFAPRHHRSAREQELDALQQLPPG